MHRQHPRIHISVSMLVGLLCATLAFAGDDGSGTSTVGERGDKLRVHEWGTFTSLQDEQGLSLGGVNTDDEPVPEFVHRSPIGKIIEGRRVEGVISKAVPRAYPRVTMRLETPVIYFHLPQDLPVPLSVDVEVDFHGGWLTEFYPRPKSVRPGVKGGVAGRAIYAPLTEKTFGQLKWHELQVGVPAAGPETDAHVWLAPRAVDAADVTTPEGESERYIFYRGVAHRNAPIRVVRDTTRDMLRLSPHSATVEELGPLAFDYLWLVDVREDGATAFRTLPSWVARRASEAEPGTDVEMAASFSEVEYSLANQEILRADMHDALVAEGLYGDEAAAMLATWELSYFKSPGLRLFFLVPRVWTDHILPLRISVPSSSEESQMLPPSAVERVMMGRIELVNPRQRQLLQEIAAGPVPERDSETLELDPEHLARFEALGRFRDALVLHEKRARPTEALQRFVELLGIR